MILAGRLLMILALASVLSGCNASSDSAASSNAAPSQYQPPPLPEHAQPKLQTIKLFVGPEVVDAEVAITFDQQRTGMMYRTNLTDKDAMIFVRPYPERASFWMKNCPESLSAAYIDPAGVIQEIHHLEKQDTNSVVSAIDDVKYVLEMKDGWFDRHHIRTGTVIRTEFGSLKQTFSQNQ